MLKSLLQKTLAFVPLHLQRPLIYGSLTLAALLSAYGVIPEGKFSMLLGVLGAALQSE